MKLRILKSSAIWMLIPLAFMAVAGAIPAVAAQTCSSGSTSISSNFNGTSIKGGDWIWFNAHIDWKGPTTDGVTIYFTQQSESSSYFTLGIPDGEIVFSSSVTTATTTYFSSGGPTGGPYWLTTVPAGTTTSIFVSALAYQVPAGGFPGGINPTTWSGCFSESGASTCDSSLQWQWGAAVYTYVPTNADGSPNYNSFGVAPTDAAGVHAGTPTAIEHYVIGGARGGGGANYTGSWSGTAAVTVPCSAPPSPCTSTSGTSVLTVNSVDTTGNVLTGFEVDGYCQGSSIGSGFTPATFTLDNGVTYTFDAVQTAGSCTFAYWQDTGSSSVDRSVTITSDTTLTAVYNCGTGPASSVVVQTLDQNGNVITGYYVQLFDSSGTQINSAYSTATFQLTSGATYSVAPNSYGSCTFAYWQDTGSTSAVRAFVASATAQTFVAIYACT